MKVDIASVLQSVNLRGMLAVALVDSITAMIVSEHSTADIDLESLAAYATSLLVVEQNILGSIQSIVVSFGRYTHIVQPLTQSPDVFLYLVVDDTATLALVLDVLRSLDSRLGAI